MARYLHDAFPAYPVLHVARQARAAGFRTAVLSNRLGRQPYDPHAGFDLYGTFDEVVLSAEHGVRKPDPSMTTGGVGFTADDGRMRETPEELHELQSLLRSSLSGSTAHLRSIVEGRTITAAQLTGVLTGMCTLALATVTARGEPRISGADGHFLHGRWHFGTARNAAKTRHLAARPAASVAHMRGEDLGVFTHGTVEELNPEDAEATADWQELLAYLKDFYGDDDAFDWNREVVYYRLNPHWMTVYAPDLDKGRAAGQGTGCRLL